MVKLFIDPGHGGTDPGAVGHGLQEKALTLEIGRQIRDILLREYVGVDVKMSRTTDVFLPLTERTRLANQWGATYFVSIHINAGGGSGFETFVHSSRRTQTVKLQSVMHDEMMTRLQVADRGQKAADFAVLRGTKMPAILTENLFIDRTTDAHKLKSGAFLRLVAEAHVFGLAQAFQLQKKSVIPSQNSMYRVQSGSFEVMKNANQVKKKIEEAGYSPFIRLENGLHKVQVGAFSNQSNAESLAAELRKKGFTAGVFRS